MAIGPDGRVFVAGDGSRIAVFDDVGNQQPDVNVTGGDGQCGPGLVAMVALEVDSAGNFYVADNCYGAGVHKEDASGKRIRTLFPGHDTSLVSVNRDTDSAIVGQSELRATRSANTTRTGSCSTPTWLRTR